MSYQHCKLEAKGRTLVVTLNRPDQRNALNPPANHELGEVFDAFENNPEYWVAIVTGEGSKAFCAGADLKSHPEDGGVNFVPASGFAGLTSRYARRKPVIAAVNGFATGGGFELALACDIIVASETAKFGLTEPRVGLAALGGGIQRLIREIGLKRAHAMLLTGRLCSAEEGLRLGFVNEVVSPGELIASALRWADEIAQCSPASIYATKAVANALDGQSVQAAVENMLTLPAVKALFKSPDAQEGPRAFAEKRAPRWSDPS
ncbi:MAG: enoyl-CoA hydratase [Rhodospirillaceae bacterium]|nr:MAG: enoyl-CoA hydratase [Rhodospirillaceae bacterium]